MNIKFYFLRSYRFMSAYELRSYHNCFNNISIILRMRFNKKSDGGLLKGF